MLSLDLHTHTRFFHGFPGRPTPYDPVGARLLGAMARWRGLDGVALTNHDYYEPFDTGSTVSLSGIEVTTTLGHVLVVGPDPPRVTRAGELTPGEVVDAAHDHSCAAILAHPYRNSTVRDSDAEVDAIEVNGKHPRTREWVEHLAADRDLPLVGGSDAHYPFEVGRAYTRVDADDPSPESVVAAIRDGRVEPVVRTSGADRLFRRTYRRIHAGKRQLQTPEWADGTPGVGAPPGREE
ncbi:CehA/McbA family metallohydrolase [Halomarina litorea]|uniref:CehA/McbA family metallohydrolase n=1 Tax=Halomarina litorea TaxID=2961595 RepID=UPI0020C3FD0A|nr:CehA/McbA family metallohydrolase [Halomarina sp. BCD28]